MERNFVTHFRSIMDTMATGSMGLSCSPSPVLTMVASSSGITYEKPQTSKLYHIDEGALCTGMLDYLLYPLYDFVDFMMCFFSNISGLYKLPNFQ